MIYHGIVISAVDGVPRRRGRSRFGHGNGIVDHDTANLVAIAMARPTDDIETKLTRDVRSGQPIAADRYGKFSFHQTAGGNVVPLNCRSRGPAALAVEEVECKLEICVIGVEIIIEPDINQARAARLFSPIDIDTKVITQVVSLSNRQTTDQGRRHQGNECQPKHICPLVLDRPTALDSTPSKIIPRSQELPFPDDSVCTPEITRSCRRRVVTSRPSDPL